MKKNILFSIVVLSLLVLVSFGFSGSKTITEDFVPLEKGETYKIFLSQGQQLKFTILEEPKENWVKVDMKGGGNYYLSLDNVVLIPTD